jgi:DNA-directed RNA polymerase specialized sigma24 family protein
MNLIVGLRGAAYSRYGIFRASACLSQLEVRTPSEQLAGVALFLHRGLGAVEESARLLGAAEDTRQVLDRLLRATVIEHRSELTGYLRRLSELAELVNEFVAWEPCQDFAELLSLLCRDVYMQVAERYARRFSRGVLEFADLATQFVMAALPRAVRSFDLARGVGSEAAWLRRVYSNYALKALAADTLHRRQLQALAETYQAAGSAPDEEELAGEGLRDRLAAARAWGQEHPREWQALALYYGLGGREHTLAEVGRALACSAYHAKAAVVAGLMGLAADLSARGPLDDPEFRMLQTYFRQGGDLDAAARELGLSRSQAHTLLGRVQQTFARALRRRTGTSPARPSPDPVSKE